MNMTEKTDFATEYRRMTDEQLLGIAGEGELVDEAKFALQVEMQNRKLTPEMVQSYRSETLRYQLAQKAEDPNVRRSLFGLGFNLCGRAYLSEEDGKRGIQVRTKWFTLRGLPIVPIASYRYSCQDVTTGLVQWKEEKLIDQVPLNWNQAMRTWVKSTGLLVLAIALTFLFLAWQDRAHR
jgi:hypothetical protein